MFETRCYCNFTYTKSITYKPKRYYFYFVKVLLKKKCTILVGAKNWIIIKEIQSIISS